MDPNACMDIIADLLPKCITPEGSAEYGEELDEACSNLKGWLDAGGFAPSWGLYTQQGPNGSAVGYFMAREGTRHVPKEFR